MTAAIFVLAILAAGAPAADDLGTLDSYRTALAAVERAVGALGGEAGAAGLDAVAFTLDIVAQAQYQGPRPEPPYLEVPVTLAVDAAPGRRWARSDTSTVFPDNAFRNVLLLGPDGGAQVDPETGRATPAPLAWEDFARDFRRSPQLVVRDAWERRAHLRWLGTATVEGSPCDLVSFPYFGRQEMTLAIDPEGRLLRHEFLFDDLLAGDATVQASFTGYRRDPAGRWLPTGYRQHEAGVAAFEGRYTRLEVGGEPRAETFAAAAPEVEDGAGGEGPGGTGVGEETAGAAAEASEEPERAGAEPAAGPLRLAGGVHLLRRLEGQDYNSLLVDLGDYFVVVESPIGAGAAEEIVAAAAAVDPGKPVRYVVATHHHGDHSGGVPHLTEATGAAVVTTAGNVEFFRRATAARRTLAGPVAAPAGPAEVVQVGGGEWQLRGERTLRVFELEADGHAAEMLVAWLPEAGILFQGDLIQFAEGGGPEPARPHARRLLELVDERGLEPVGIAGVHGRVGSLAELRQAVAEAAADPAP